MPRRGSYRSRDGRLHEGRPTDAHLAGLLRRSSRRHRRDGGTVDVAAMVRSEAPPTASKSQLG
jgi:hypothetical protein